VTRKVRIAATGSSQEIAWRSRSFMPTATASPSMERRSGVDESIEKGKFDNFRIDPQDYRTPEEEGHQLPVPDSSLRLSTSAYDGQDLVGRDRTGSGKTLAYSLPIIERFRADGLFTRSDGLPKLLILVPTRELALQGISKLI
jgi:superfamily II DNA/RNA helicase